MLSSSSSSSKPKRRPPSAGQSYGHLNHHHHGPISRRLACLVVLFAASIRISNDKNNNTIPSSSSFSSIFFVHAVAAATPANDNNTNNNNDINNLSFQQVFQAIDSNRDHSISQEEYLAAAKKLLLVVGGNNDGEGPPSGDSVVAATARSGGNDAGDAPPLGMDYNNNPLASPSALSASRGRQPNLGDSGLFSAAAASSSAATTTTASFVKGLVSSFSAIMATEIGDKTFFIAAVLSMRNDRMAVFGGAILALVIMTALSTLMGLVLPALLPKKYTHVIGGLLFLYFGVKLLLDSRSMQKNKVSEELEEVEEELAEMSKKQNKARKKKRAEEEGKGKGGGKPLINGGANYDDDDDIVDVEDGGGGRVQQQQQQQQQQQMESADSDMNGAKKRRGAGGGGGSGRTIKHAPSSSGFSAAGNYNGGSWESVFVQSLTLTFLAEWGDRSQIATIALAAAKDPVGVAIGGCIGHSVCTGMAVIGGRMLASRISEKSVAFYGGLVFLIFGFHSVFFEE